MATTGIHCYFEMPFNNWFSNCDCESVVLVICGGVSLKRLLPYRCYMCLMHSITHWLHKRTYRVQVCFAGWIFLGMINLSLQLYFLSALCTHKLCWTVSGSEKCSRWFSGWFFSIISFSPVLHHLTQFILTHVIDLSQLHQY